MSVLLNDGGLRSLLEAHSGVRSSVGSSVSQLITQMFAAVLIMSSRKVAAPTARLQPANTDEEGKDQTPECCLCPKR